jgi:hypothetical protein
MLGVTQASNFVKTSWNSEGLLILLAKTSNSVVFQKKETHLPSTVKEPFMPSGNTYRN